MTKLLEWLVATTMILATWGAIVSNRIDNEFTKEYMHLIVPAPMFFLIFFGLYTATLILYRTLTFNTCEEAANELKKEIEMAKKDLKNNKGYVF